MFASFYLTSGTDQASAHPQHIRYAMRLGQGWHPKHSGPNGSFPQGAPVYNNCVPILLFLLLEQLKGLISELILLVGARTNDHQQGFDRVGEGQLAELARFA